MAEATVGAICSLASDYASVLDEFPPRDGCDTTEIKRQRVGSWTISKLRDCTTGSTITKPRRVAACPDDYGVDKVWEQRCRAFIGKIDQQVRDDRIEAIADGDTPPTSEAARVCMYVANRIVHFVALYDDVLSAAFGEETGGISLVLRSDRTGRRVNFRVAADGALVTVIRIDRDMDTRSDELAPDDARELKELAGWVTQVT